VRRPKRHFEYFAPVNITERITQDFLDNLIANIDFSRTADDILEDNIDLKDPVFVPGSNMSEPL
jgi:hypothetical protein